MRARAMTPQTGGLRGFGLKRSREGEGTPGMPGTPGTPLLQAGQASEAVRRIRQRGDQVCARPEHPPSLRRPALHSPPCSSAACLRLCAAQPQPAHCAYDVQILGCCVFELRMLSCRRPGVQSGGCGGLARRPFPGGWAAQTAAPATRRLRQAGWRRPRATRCP